MGKIQKCVGWVRSNPETNLDQQISRCYETAHAFDYDLTSIYGDKGKFKTSVMLQELTKNDISSIIVTSFSYIFRNTLDGIKTANRILAKNISLINAATGQEVSNILEFIRELFDEIYYNEEAKLYGYNIDEIDYNELNDYQYGELCSMD